MKREMGLVLATVISTVVLSSGCVSHRAVVVRERGVAVAPATEVVVTTEPPPIRHEVIGVAPSTRHVWIEGFWTYHEGHWIWSPGHWELRPRRGVAWRAGHWDRTPRGWVWRAGYWR